jgi:osmotically inducible protein OsmC
LKTVPGYGYRGWQIEFPIILFSFAIIKVKQILYTGRAVCRPANSHFFTYYFNTMINQRGKAVWNGDMKGHGTISTQSGVVEAQYSVGSRFEGQKGTNPEELIGAAHAGCYTMFLTNVLGQHGHTVESITTTSTVTLDPTQNPPKITKIHVSTEGKVTGGNITPEDFQKHAEFAKANCPVSQVLSAVPEMTLEAKLA